MTSCQWSPTHAANLYTCRKFVHYIAAEQVVCTSSCVLHSACIQCVLCYTDWVRFTRTWVMTCNDMRTTISGMSSTWSSKLDPLFNMRRPLPTSYTLFSKGQYWSLNWPMSWRFWNSCKQLVHRWMATTVPGCGMDYEMMYCIADYCIVYI